MNPTLRALLLAAHDEREASGQEAFGNWRTCADVPSARAAIDWITDNCDKPLCEVLDDARQYSYSDPVTGGGRNILLHGVSVVSLCYDALKEANVC